MALFLEVLWIVLGDNPLLDHKILKGLDFSVSLLLSASNMVPSAEQAPRNHLLYKHISIKNINFM